MPKIRFTKNELKKQKDELKRFTRYLPALQLKKQQLRSEIIKIQRNIDDCVRQIKLFRNNIEKWADVFAEETGIENLIKIKEIKIGAGNIAGTEIPILEKVEFTEEPYNFHVMPLWVDYAIDALKKALLLEVRRVIFEKQFIAVVEELRVTTQRVNLFEKVKIPEACENIRKIRIYLGDIETRGVVIGKIAKEKIEKKEEHLAVV